MIVMVRVDDRLIHGQIALSWTRTLGATHIVVVNDEVAKDNTQKMLLKIATPVSVKSTILPVAEAAAFLVAEKSGSDKVLVLVREPQSLLTLMEGGVKLDKVNIGNVRMAEGRERLIKEIAATPEEIRAWKKLDEKGVELEALWLPGGTATNFNEVIRRHG